MVLLMAGMVLTQSPVKPRSAGIVYGIVCYVASVLSNVMVPDSQYS